MNISKRYIVDDSGKPKEVIIALKDYKKIEELLGLDLNDKTRKQLRDAKRDRDRVTTDAYVDLDEI